MESRRGGEGIERARELFKAAAAVDAGHAPVWQAWAIAEQRAGNGGRAESLFAKAVKADPSHAPSWQAFALFEASRGDVSKARQLFQRGRQADPGHVPTLQAWACLEARRGDPSAARRLFRKAHRVCVSAAKRSGADMNSNSDAGSSGDAARNSGDAAIGFDSARDRSSRRDGSRIMAEGGLGGPRDGGNAASASSGPASSRGDYTSSRMDDASGDAGVSGGHTLGGRDDLMDFRDPFDMMDPDLSEEEDGLDWEEGGFLKSAAMSSPSTSSSTSSTLGSHAASVSTQPGAGEATRHRHLAPLLRAWAGFEARQRRADLARQLLRQACAVAPHDPRGWLQWGELERRAGRPGRAAELLMEGLARDPRSAHLKHALAQLYAKEADRVTDAKSLLRQVVASDPLNGHGWHALGMLELEAGRFEQARHYFQMGACGAGNPLGSITPANGTRSGSFGSSKQQQQQQQGSSKQPHQGGGGRDTAGAVGGGVTAAGGYASKEAGDAEFASSSIGREAGAPRNARCYAAWAALEAQSGRYDLAREIYREGSLTEEGQRVSYLRAWGLFEKNRGSTGAARSLFRACTRQDPSDPKLWLLWGQMERKVGNLDAARQCFEKGLQARHKYSFIWQAWARMEADTGHLEEARSLFERGCEACAEDAPLWMEYALFELKWALERPQREARAAAASAAAAAAAAAMAGSASGGSSIAEDDTDEEEDEDKDEGEEEDEEEEEARPDVVGWTRTAPGGVPVSPTKSMMGASGPGEAGALGGARDATQVKGGGVGSDRSVQPPVTNKRELRLRPVDVVLVRGLFEKGGAIDPPHVPLYQAWARFEERWGSSECLSRIHAVLEENMAPTDEGY
eukprot:jgi/Mesvir1/27487/Mv07259-RA.1